MLRLLNFVFPVVSALICLGCYQISEHTRIANAELHRVDREIVQEQNRMTVLQAEWARVADPARIQKLAEADLGIADTPTVELSSLTMLPRRNADGPGDAQLHSASAQGSAAAGHARVRLAAIRMRD